MNPNLESCVPTAVVLDFVKGLANIAVDLAQVVLSEYDPVDDRYAIYLLKDS